MLSSVRNGSKAITRTLKRPFSVNSSKVQRVFSSSGIILVSAGILCASGITLSYSDWFSVGKKVDDPAIVSAKKMIAKAIEDDNEKRGDG